MFEQKNRYFVHYFDREVTEVLSWGRHKMEEGVDSFVTTVQRHEVGGLHLRRMNPNAE